MTTSIVDKVAGTVSASGLSLQGVPVTLVACGIPFVMFGGNGSTTGLQFTGSAGAFTLTAAILTNAFNFLAAGGYAYFPVNFGGQTIAAGWYFVKMTDDTHGTVYQDTYTSGQPVIPASPTAFVANLTGWLTQTISEVTALNGFTLSGNSLGKNGMLTSALRVVANSSAGSKSARFRVAGAGIFNVQPATSYLDSDTMYWMQNMGGTGKQLITRQGVGGVGTNYTSYGNDVLSVDTSVDQAMSFTLQLATNTDSVIAVFRSVTAQYGA